VDRIYKMKCTKKLEYQPVAISEAEGAVGVLEAVNFKEATESVRRVKTAKC